MLLAGKYKKENPWNKRLNVLVGSLFDSFSLAGLQSVDFVHCREKIG